MENATILHIYSKNGNEIGTIKRGPAEQGFDAEVEVNLNFYVSAPEFGLGCEFKEELEELLNKHLI